jgi:hypothetical protein
MIFSNPDEARGYALGLGDQTAQNATAIATNLTARLFGPRRYALDQTSADLIEALRTALAAETQRADTMLSEADKLYDGLVEAADAIRQLEIENRALKDELARVKKANELPPYVPMYDDDEYSF